MKILNVITGMQKAAGTSVFCGEVANGLVAASHEATIAVGNPNSKDHCPIDPRVKLISIVSLVQPTNHQPPTANHYDLVHIHALWSPILHRVSKWAHKNKIPVVWSPHGMLTPWAMHNKWLKKHLGWWLYQRWDLAKADLLHVTADSEVEDVRRMGLKNKILVAPLGVRINGSMEHVERVGRKKTLLFVSRVQKKKGLINLAKAWALLSTDARVGWKVRIVGPDQEGHTDEVKQECERLSIVGEWEFAGPMFGDDLEMEYRRASLFVLPTHSENFGSVVIEALARDVPVITTKGTPWQELEDWKCGWWIDVGVEPLVAALKDAMALSDAERHEMGERGRRLVEEKYTWDAVVKKMVEGYEGVVSGWWLGVPCDGKWFNEIHRNVHRKYWGC